jgi:putative transposase
MYDSRYKIRDQHAIHFVTFTIVQWVDALTRPEYKDIIVESIKFCQKNKGLKIYAWVVMTNHVHFVCSASETNKLSDIIRDLKKYTSYKVIKAIEENPQESRKSWMLWIFKKAGEQNKRNEKYQFWQQENHPIECSSLEILQTRINYIHENPVRAGYVNLEGDYRYSSGIDYFKNESGLIEISTY